MDIVTFMDDDEATDGCYVKIVHRVQFHKHHLGYCFQQYEIKKPDDKEVKSRKRTSGHQVQKEDSSTVIDDPVAVACYV